jgi:hypothetical protein
MKRNFVFLNLLNIIALSLVATGILLAQTSPQVGAWKLNVEKSKYVTAPEPKSLTRTVETQGNGAKISFDGVAADGSRMSYSFKTNYDGKDSPISGTGFTNGADTIAIKRVDANTTTTTAKKAGKVVLTTRTVVSSDGKVTTITAKGTNEQGQPMSYTSVYDKR